MRHDEALALVERQFTQDDLTPAEGSALRAHLRACEGCRARYDALAEAEEALAPEVAHRAAAARLWPEVAAAPVVGARSRVRRVPWRVVAPLAAAAAILLVLVWPRPPPSGRTLAYGLEMSPGRSLLRGADAGVTDALPILAADGRLEVLLRPATPQAEALEARAYRRTPEGLAPLPLRWERSEQGVLRGTASGAEALPEVGRHTLVVVLGPNRGMPAPGEVAVRLPEGGGPARVEGGAWSAWVRRIERR